MDQTHFPAGATTRHLTLTTRRDRFLLWLAPLVAACAIGSSNTYPATAPARPAVDVPPAFVLEDSTAGAPAPSEASCRSPLRDPRDGTRLILRSSQGGIGDYEVPPDRYGVGPGEYLRVDCRTRQPIGAVPRPG